MATMARRLVSDELWDWETAAVSEPSGSTAQSHPDAAARGRDPGRARPPPASPPPAACALRRPRLPLARGPPRVASARHPGQDRVAEEPARLRTRHQALGGRAHDRLAAP